MFLFCLDLPVWVYYVWAALMYWMIGLVVDYYANDMPGPNGPEPPSSAIILWPPILLVFVCSFVFTHIERFHKWLLE